MAGCQLPRANKVTNNVKHPVVLAVAVILPPLPWNQTELADILDVFCSKGRCQKYPEGEGHLVFRGVTDHFLQL